MRIVFIGTGDIGLPVLHWLRASAEHQLVGVVTQPDKPVGRDQRIQASPIKAAAAAAGIPVLQPERIRREEAVREIAALLPEVIVVMAYGQILPRAVLQIPTAACLNLHASLLPRHRGAAPIQAAIAEGDRETGIAVMYMDEGLDTGDVLLLSRIDIAPEETGGSLHDRLAQIAPEALRQALGLLATKTAPRVPQDDAQATYAPKLEREHGAIDWTQPAEVIERKIRSFDPWPGAYTVVADATGKKKKLKIYRASIDRTIDLPCGQIASSQNGGLLIGAADEALRLEEVQLEGKRRMSSSDLVRGNPGLARSTA